MPWLMVRGYTKGQETLARRAARDSTEAMILNKLPEGAETENKKLDQECVCTSIQPIRGEFENMLMSYQLDYTSEIYNKLVLGNIFTGFIIEYHLALPA